MYSAQGKTACDDVPVPLLYGERQNEKGVCGLTCAMPARRARRHPRSGSLILADLNGYHPAGHLRVFGALGRPNGYAGFNSALLRRAASASGIILCSCAAQMVTTYNQRPGLRAGRITGAYRALYG